MQCSILPPTHGTIDRTRGKIGRTKGDTEGEDEYLAMQIGKEELLTQVSYKEISYETECL